MRLDDAIAIGLALAAAAWLVRRSVARRAAPCCDRGGDLPAGADGFVPLGRIAPPLPGRGTSDPPPDAAGDTAKKTVWCAGVGSRG